MENGGDFRPIAHAARIVWAVAAIPVLALTLLMAALLILVHWAFGVGLSLLTLVAALAWWTITGRRWRAWGYAERERDLIVRRGVLVRRLTIVPYGRMQFVEVKQGPFERILGLSTVALHTAAAATDAQIPYLPTDEAHRLRERLTELGETHAAGV